MAQNASLSREPIDTRHFNREHLQEMIESGEFEYGNAPRLTSGDFWSWLLSKFGKGVGTVLKTPYLVKTIAVLLVLAALYYSFRTWNIQLFRKKDENNHNLGLGTTNNDIYKQNIEELLQKAISQQNYREATRLLYLQLLRQLSDRKIINWKLDKTNYQYCQEIKNSDLLQHFQTLSHFYEHVWYGDFEISNVDFTEAQEEFSSTYQFISQVKG